MIMIIIIIIIYLSFVFSFLGDQIIGKSFIYLFI